MLGMDVEDLNRFQLFMRNGDGLRIFVFLHRGMAIWKGLGKRTRLSNCDYEEYDLLLGGYR
jgi:hypothetical protein